MKDTEHVEVTDGARLQIKDLSGNEDTNWTGCPNKTLEMYLLTQAKILIKFGNFFRLE